MQIGGNMTLRLLRGASARAGAQVGAPPEGIGLGRVGTLPENVRDQNRKLPQ